MALSTEWFWIYLFVCFLLHESENDLIEMACFVTQLKTFNFDGIFHLPYLFLVLYLLMKH